MNLLATLAVSLLSAVVAGLLGLGVSLACVQWYAITSFEGKSGYFVGAITLLGMLAGLVTGLVVARLETGDPAPGFLATLLHSSGVLLAVAVVAAALAWLLAPPAAPVMARIAVEPAPLAPVRFSGVPAADAPLREWLETLRYNGNPEVRRRVLAHLQDQPELLPALTDVLRGDDDSLAYAAYAALAEMPPGTLSGSDQLLVELGTALVGQLRRTTSIPVQADPGYEAAATTTLRWTGWLQAVDHQPAAVRQNCSAPLQAMVEVAASRPDSLALATTAADAGQYLRRWTAPAP